MDFVFNVIAFFGYFGGSVAFCLAFGAIYEKMTPQREFYLIVHEHNASAAISFSGAMLGYALALAGALHNTHSVLEFVVWAVLGGLAQLLAYVIGRLVHPNLSQAIEQNAIAAAVWLAATSIAAGILCAACMSP